MFRIGIEPSEYIGGTGFFEFYGGYQPQNIIPILNDKISVHVIIRLDVPDDMTQTMTFDRGFEFMSYPLLHKKLGMNTYLCDPQAPWQKGAVECNNNRIRRFLPRDIDLDNVTERDLRRIENIMNNTPRRCLGYKTPMQVFKSNLA